MRHGRSIGVIIPAFDEEDAIGLVLAEVPSWCDHIVVADNNSKDATAAIAQRAGVLVSHETQPGYGATCLAGLKKLPKVDIVVFLDGDHSDYPEDMHQLVDPIINDGVDFVIASRALGDVQLGALTPQQIFGNWLATTLIWLIWRKRYSDLGPFRAIRHKALAGLAMQDRTYGWTVEMQIKAIENELRVLEVPARYRVRIGQSKISGTVKGTVLAGYKILSIIARHAMHNGLKHFRGAKT